MGHNFIYDFLETAIGEARGYNSVLLDSYGRLADFVVSESTAEENYCSNFELLDSVLTNFFNAFVYAHLRIPLGDYIESRYDSRIFLLPLPPISCILRIFLRFSFLVQGSHEHFFTKDLSINQFKRLNVRT